MTLRNCLGEKQAGSPGLRQPHSFQTRRPPGRFPQWPSLRVGGLLVAPGGPKPAPTGADLGGTGPPG
eukprot:3236197-Pyramimonas_sp.AAC.1